MCTVELKVHIKEKETKGREGAQETGKRNHTTAHTESTHLVSLQIIVLLWKGRPHSTLALAML